MMNDIQVVKRNHIGQEVFRYPGRILALENDFILLEAVFTHEAVPVGEIIFKRGDRFIETYYFNRWYNIFEIYYGHSSELKAYYCNIGYPAVLDDGEISYRDLAIDLLVLPDGSETVLDLEEFEALLLDDTVREHALGGLAAVKAEFRAILSQAK